MSLAEESNEKRRNRSPFTARAVLTMRAPGRYCDAGCRGLWLQIGPTGRKSWVLRFMLNGKARAMGLGPLELVALAGCESGRGRPEGSCSTVGTRLRPARRISSPDGWTQPAA